VGIVVVAECIGDFGCGLVIGPRGSPKSGHRGSPQNRP
jgi:hypothetical protein